MMKLLKGLERDYMTNINFQINPTAGPSQTQQITPVSSPANPTNISIPTHSGWIPVHGVPFTSPSISDVEIEGIGNLKEKLEKIDELEKKVEYLLGIIHVLKKKIIYKDGDEDVENPERH